MTNLYELKMGAEKLEALKFLLSQITELETVISQININEIKDANTLTKEQIATLQDVKSAVEAISSDLSLKKTDFDEKKQIFDINMSAFINDKADFDEKKADFDSKNNTALSNFAFISSNVEKINSTSALLAEAKTILETIKPMEQRTQAALDTIANSQAKFAELYALGATLLELKKSLENIITTGLINDTSASSTTTYSSTKINALTQAELVCQYAHQANGQLLPDGDYSSSDFWLSVNPGIYYAVGEKGRNKPANYGLVEVISNGEVSITWNYLGRVWKWYQGYNKQNSGWQEIINGADFACLKDPNGYTKLPNGLIIQWGKTGKYPPGFIKIKETKLFPITFPNMCLSIASHINDQSIDDSTASEEVQNRNIYVKTNYISNRGFIFTMHTPTEATGYGWEVYWTAIGY